AEAFERRETDAATEHRELGVRDVTGAAFDFETVRQALATGDAVDGEHAVGAVVARGELSAGDRALGAAVHEVRVLGHLGERAEERELEAAVSRRTRGMHRRRRDRHRVLRDELRPRGVVGAEVIAFELSAARRRWNGGTARY